MWMDSDRDEGGEDGYGYEYATPELAPARDPNAYWRRRFFILGGGVALLGLCAWLFPGGHPAAARTSATAQASMAAVERRGELPQAAYGSPWPSPTPKQTASASPSASPSATGTGQGKAATRSYPRSSQTASPTPSRPGSGAKGPRCAPADIVLSLFTGQSSYGQDAAPTFDIYAVSTSSAACTLTYGPGSVQVVVTRHGRVVWDSSACKPPAAGPVRFTLGVPQVLSVSWNRRAAGPAGCAGTLPAGSTGTFDAVALTDGQSSPVRSFALSG
jgi:hypothetical protein